MEKVFEVNIWKYRIMEQVVTKFVSLKIDNCGDAIMSSKAIDYHAPCSKFMKLSSLYIVVEMHLCISTVINFQTTTFCDILLHDQIPQYVNPCFYQTAH